MNWYVLCTKPRHEVKTARSLEQLGFEVYCPVKTEVRQWSDRKKKVRSPLFSKYIFVRTCEQNRNGVFQAAGILNFLFWLKKPAVVPEQEINSLRSYLEDNAVDAKEIHCFKSGDSVALKHGFFKGQKAEIKNINNQRVEFILPALGYKLIAKTKDLVM